MDRRKSLKTLAVGAVATGVLVDACKPGDEKSAATTTTTTASAAADDRMKEEVEVNKKLLESHYFTKDELATITILADIIIPKDEVSGSASEAKVPEFIDYIVCEMTDHQVPLRGGLRWLDMQCLNRYGKAFVDCDEKQRMEMVNEIAWPEKAKPEMKQGVAFFNRMRDLTACGFYSTKMGWDDIGYKGNTPNQWNGVPDDVLKQYGLAYTERELKECVSFS